MKQYPLTAVAFTVVLSLAGRGHAAVAETVIAQAAGDHQPGVVAFYDSADGQTSGIDNQMSQSIAAALAGAQYLLTDTGHLKVLPAHATSSSAQPILPVVNAVDASNNQGSYYLVHMRSGHDFMDGAVSRDLQNPAASYVILDLVLFDQQGDSEAIHIEQNLTWATSPGAVTSPGSGTSPGAGSSSSGTAPSSGGTPADGGSTPNGPSPLGSGQPTGGAPSIF